MFGALASGAGGAGNHAAWAWLTASRVAQNGMTPLHWAATRGRDAAIRALVAAKADVHAKTDVRVGGRGRLGVQVGRGRGVCIVILWFGSLNLRLLKDPILEPSTQPSIRNPYP